MANYRNDLQKCVFAEYLLKNSSRKFQLRFNIIYADRTWFTNVVVIFLYKYYFQRFGYFGEIDTLFEKQDFIVWCQWALSAQNFVDYVIIILTALLHYETWIFMDVSRIIHGWRTVVFFRRISSRLLFQGNSEKNFDVCDGLTSMINRCSHPWKYHYPWKIHHAHWWISVHYQEWPTCGIQFATFFYSFIRSSVLPFSRSLLSSFEGRGWEKVANVI